MNDRTRSAIVLFEKAEWFSQVGVELGNNVNVLSSWQEAMKYCDSVDGDNFGLFATNTIGGRVRARADDRFQQWNSIVKGLEPTIKSLVKGKIEKLIVDNNLPRKRFEAMVYKGILSPCIELEYHDVIQPGYFASIAYWYIKGHFPCGWKAVKYSRPKIDAEGKKRDGIDLYPPGFYDSIAKWYEKGDFGDWQGHIPPPGKLIVY